LHVLRNAGVAPPWIEADKDVRRLLADRDAMLERAAQAWSAMTRARYRRELTRIVTAHAAAVARLNAEAPTTRLHRRPMVLHDELEALERAWPESRSPVPGPE
jgi:hypothetical protein